MPYVAPGSTDDLEEYHPPASRDDDGRLVLGPRLVVAGTHSGVGKTTVATGLIAALRQAGHRLAAAKIGPDFIDPGYHALASGRPPRNLDPWLCGEAAMVPLAARAGANSDMLLIEGVMGLFDGAGDGTVSSTADVAALLQAPVLLVVDASAMSSSVAAVVHGYATLRPGTNLGGVILNRVGSPGHETLLREALQPLGFPVVGVLPRDDAMRWRDRHLGLVPVAERRPEVAAAIDRLAALIGRHVDLAAVVALAGEAPSIVTVPPLLPELGPSLRVGVAGGQAFTFTYTDTIDALEAAGATVVSFDPLSDQALPPDLDGLMLGGGFPEVFGSDLSANRGLLSDLHRHVTAGLTTWAECGGLLVLAASLDGRPMAGVIPADARMTDRLTLGYRQATTTRDTPLGPVGTTLRGHEFHYSAVDPPGDALTLTSRWGEGAEGWASPNLLATYLHHHPGGDPGPVTAFVRQCVRQSALRNALRGSH